MADPKEKIFSDNKLIADLKNPFSRDYSGKLEQVSKSFTQLCENETKNKPLIISIDAPYGMGKTAFIDMWGQSLLNEEKIAIKFDAWKADHSEAPLLALISEINNQLSRFEKEFKIIEEIKKGGIEICKVLIPTFFKFGMTSIIASAGLGKITEDVLNTISASFEKKIEKEVTEYNNQKNVLDNFKENLRKLTDKKTVFLFIDELDRCKPTFAIRLLEIIKHIFDIDNLCCVLSTNTKALSNTVQAIYGYRNSGAKDYLERFVDTLLMLPEPDKIKFAESKLTFLDNSTDKIPKEHLNAFKETIKKCCQLPAINFRIIEKYITDIKIFLASNQSVEEGKKVPSIYYPSVAFEIAKKRINNKSEEKLLKSLESGTYFKWINNFFTTSKSQEELITTCKNLSSLLNHGDPAKNQHQLLNSIYKEIDGLYNTKSNQSFRSFPPSIDRYKNHHSNAIQLIKSFELIHPNDDQFTTENNKPMLEVETEN